MSAVLGSALPGFLPLGEDELLAQKRREIDKR